MWDTKRYFVIHLLNKTYYLSITRPFLRREKQPTPVCVCVCVLSSAGSTNNDDDDNDVGKNEWELTARTHSHTPSMWIDVMWVNLAIFNGTNRKVPVAKNTYHFKEHNIVIDFRSDEYGSPLARSPYLSCDTLEQHVKKVIVCVCWRCCFNESHLPSNILTIGDTQRTEIIYGWKWVCCLMGSSLGGIVWYSMATGFRHNTSKQ